MQSWCSSLQGKHTASTHGPAYMARTRHEWWSGFQIDTSTTMHALRHRRFPFFVRPRCCPDQHMLTSSNLSKRIIIANTVLLEVPNSIQSHLTLIGRLRFSKTCRHHHCTSCCILFTNLFRMGCWLCLPWPRLRRHALSLRRSHAMQGLVKTCHVHHTCYEPRA